MRKTQAADLKAFRAKYELTQQALADLLGMTRNAVTMMEMGIRPIMPRTRLALDAIARQLASKESK